MEKRLVVREWQDYRGRYMEWKFFASGGKVWGAAIHFDDTIPESDLDILHFVRQMHDTISYAVTGEVPSEHEVRLAQRLHDALQGMVQP